MSSTNHMLSVMRPLDSTEEHLSSSVDELPVELAPGEQKIVKVYDNLPTPSLSMADVLTQCLSLNKKPDHSPQ